MTTTRTFAVLFLISVALLVGVLLGRMSAWQYVPVVAAAIVGLISLCIILADVLSGSVKRD